MNPDSSSSEDKASLPEVPSIFPAPNAEVTPEITPEPVSLPVQPPARPVVPFGPTSGIVSDIRPAAPQPPVVASSPLTPEAPSPFTNTQTAAPAASAPKKQPNILLIVGVIVGIPGLLIGIGAVLPLFIFGNNGKVADADLISATTDGTTYLRPKQWQSVSFGDVTGYGNKLAKDGKSTALMAATKGSYVGAVDNATSTQVETFRSGILKTISASYAASLIKQYGACDSTSNVNTTESTRSNTNSYGIFKLTGNCSKDGASYTVAHYTLLGKDGYIRSITLMATDTNWKQNETVFNKIIDSADQE